MGGLLDGWLGHKRSWCLLCVTTWVSLMALFGLTTQFDVRVGVLAMVAGLLGLIVIHFAPGTGGKMRPHAAS